MYKMAIITNDIEMSCGKLAAQTAHAAVEAALISYKKKRRILKKWRAEGAKKVVVKAKEKEMLELEEKARENQENSEYSKALEYYQQADTSKNHGLRSQSGE